MSSHWREDDAWLAHWKRPRKGRLTRTRPKILNKAITIAAFLSLSLLAHDTRADSSASQSRSSQVYEITKQYDTTEQVNNRSRGSSRGREAYLERVIAERNDGLELEYDFPENTPKQVRDRSWQFPVRILLLSNGSMKILNRLELELRVEDWLKSAGWTREVCGQWMFTWSAFRIECDPGSVLKILRNINLRDPGIRDGAQYQEDTALTPGTLIKNKAGESRDVSDSKTDSGPDRVTLTTELQIDPESVRRTRAESDVVVGKIMRKPVTLEAALQKRAKDNISGKMTVSFDLDSASNIVKRTRLSTIETTSPDGKTEIQTVTETVERRLLP